MMTKAFIILFIIFNFFGTIYADEEVYIPSQLVDIEEPTETEQGAMKAFSTETQQSISESDLQIQANISQYIREKTGLNYFNEHFSESVIEKKERTWFFHYNYTYGQHSIDMHVGYDFKKDLILPQFSNVLFEAQEISFSKDDSINKATDLGLIEPFSTGLVYLSEEGILAWRIDRVHEPTMEERKNEEISGYIISAIDGELIKTLRYRIEVTDVSMPLATDEPQKEEKATETPIKKFIDFLKGFWRSIFN